MLKKLVPVAAILFLAAPALAADKVDVKKLKGTWERDTGNNVKISFEFKDEKTMVCRITADQTVEMDCSYSVDKEGVLSGEITNIDKKGNDSLPDKGTKFAFTIEAGEKKIVLSKLTVNGANDDGAKQLVEGEYSKK